MHNNMFAMRINFLFACLSLLFLNLGSQETPYAATNNLTESLRSVEQCPPWLTKSSDSKTCECEKTLQGVVSCKSSPYSLSLYACFCMSYDNRTNLLLVGSCQYTCKTARGYYNDITANTSSQINELICDKHKREGQLCGSCMTGYAPPVYSYSLSCVRCSTSNWVKFITISLLPLTLFYIIIITIRLSVTSPWLNGFVVCLQLTMSPPNLRIAQIAIKQHIYVPIMTSLGGIWNLDFLRLIYTPFCLQPHTQTLQVIALDYLIAVYPLLLIALSYLLVFLYDHNVRLIVCVCRPCVPLFVRFRRQWNIKSSLIDAFATFLLLSYVKVLSVSVDLLMPVVLYDNKQDTLDQVYLFNQGNMKYLGVEHLPYVCLALFFLFTFIFLPMLLLFLYPCSCFQACLNRTGCRYRLLHTFMDTFQGHYKDGTNGTRDLRFFSGLYLLLRVVVYASTMVAYQIGNYAYTSVIIGIFAVSVALVQPYKRHACNVIDACFLAITHILFITLVPLGFGRFARLEIALTILNAVLVPIPFCYVGGLVLWQIKSQGIVSKCYQTLHLKFANGRQSPYHHVDYDCLN